MKKNKQLSYFIPLIIVSVELMIFSLIALILKIFIDSKLTIPIAILTGGLSILFFILSYISYKKQGENDEKEDYVIVDHINSR